jgi:hypothetical protein
LRGWGELVRLEWGKSWLGKKKWQQIQEGGTEGGAEDNANKAWVERRQVRRASGGGAQSCRRDPCIHSAIGTVVTMTCTSVCAPFLLPLLWPLRPHLVVIHTREAGPAHVVVDAGEVRCRHEVEALHVDHVLTRNLHQLIRARVLRTEGEVGFWGGQRGKRELGEGD